MAQRVRRIAIPLLVLVVAAALVWFLGPWSKPNPNGAIHASGTIEATEVAVSSKIPGRLVLRKVDEGDEVHRGELIAKLDTSQLVAQVRQAKAAVANAQAHYEEALHGARPEQIAQAQAQLAQAQAGVAGAKQALLNARKGYRTVTDLRAQVDAATTREAATRAALKQSQDALTLVKKGPREQQVTEARAAVDQAKVALAKAESDLKRLQALFDQGAISPQQRDAAQTTRDSARTQLEQSQAHLADLLAGSRPEEVAQAEMAVQQAQANLEGARLATKNARDAFSDRLAAKSQYDAAQASLKASQAQERAARAQLDLLLAGSRIEDIQAAEAQVKQAKAALKLAEEQLADAVVVSPINGVVETKSAEPGEVVAAGAPIVTLTDLDHVWLRVYVPESQYGRLKLRQRVDVKVDSFPGRVFEGRVSEIASQAEFTPKNVQTQQERVKLVFGVKVTVSNAGHELKPGMPADAVIRGD